MRWEETDICFCSLVCFFCYCLKSATLNFNMKFKLPGNRNHVLSIIGIIKRYSKSSIHILHAKWYARQTSQLHRHVQVMYTSQITYMHPPKCTCTKHVNRHFLAVSLGCVSTKQVSGLQDCWDKGTMLNRNHFLLITVRR